MRPVALLLIGPTGSGKTPLGNLLERKGLRGMRCRHFDFGAQLRRAAELAPDFTSLTAAEQQVVRDALASNRLLAPEEFTIAAKILAEFLRSDTGWHRTLVILNGLPRHVHQAVALEPLVDVPWLVHLHCTPETVRERIRRNWGGDRAGRSDDTEEAVARKLSIFAEQTLPLLAHYRHKGAHLIEIEVEVTSTAESLLSRIEAESAIRICL